MDALLELLQWIPSLSMKYLIAVSTLLLFISCASPIASTGGTQSPSPAASPSSAVASPSPSAPAAPVASPSLPVASTPDIPGKLAAMKACVDALPDSNPFKKALSFALGQNITAVNIYLAQGNMSAMQSTYDSTVTALKQVGSECVR